MVIAQADPPLRIELESAKDQQDYKFIPLSKYGVAVFYQSAILSIDTAQWVIIHYDTNLVRKNLFKLKLPNLCQYISADFSNDKLYLFLQKPAFKKDTLRNYILEWNIVTDDFQLFDLHNYKYPFRSSIKVVDDYIFMVINEQKAKKIVFYNHKTNTKNEWQLGDDELIAIESFTVDSIAKKTYVCLFLRNKKNTWAEIFVADYSGKIMERVVLPAYQDVIYNSITINISGKDSILLIGGYSNNRDKRQNGCFSGIFSMLFSKNRFSEINTYPFGALLEKDSSLNKKQLLESSLTMNMLVKQSNGKFFAVTQLFYPEYQHNVSSSHRGFGYYGFAPPTNVFVGFRFLNAYISEFYTKGTPLNEWFFPLTNVLTQSIYHLVNVHQDNEENSLFYYVHNNEIVSQFMNGQHVISAQSSTSVELLQRADILEYSSNLSMQHWYDNSFILSGYQYIRNSQRGKGKRYVFFLSKFILLN